MWAGDLNLNIMTTEQVRSAHHLTKALITASHKTKRKRSA
jgi:hypothetical protein